MIILIFILLLLSSIFGLTSNYPNRIFDVTEMSFLRLFIFSCIASVLSNMISFPTIYFLGKYQNIVIVECLLIVCAVIAVILINKFLVKEPIHIGSYITMISIVIILIIHYILTQPFYSRNKKMSY
jgi:hypothetical protein